ncbi:MAG: UbiA family prenyltransferase [Spirochaetales bacterium]
MLHSRWLGTLIHLRIPFSFFLLPIWLFAAWDTLAPDTFRLWLSFFIIHFLLYPASHAFNTWYDRDEKSIGGIKNPPPVTQSLFWTAWALDAAVLVTSWFVSPWFFAAMLLYTLASKAYSWKVTRLKRRPWAGWLGVGVVQGALTYLAVVQTVGSMRLWSDPLLWLGALTAALFLMGVYPLTQIYQHEEDAAHGDLTVSRRVGIRGTFVLSGAFLFLAVLSFVFLFLGHGGWPLVFLFLGLEAPTVVYFLWWAWTCWGQPSRADFGRTMGMNLMASGLMVFFFVFESFAVGRN